MKISKDDWEFIKFARSVFNRGHYPDGHKVFETYQRVLEHEIKAGTVRSLQGRNPGCMTCVRESVFTLWDMVSPIMNEIEKDEKPERDKQGKP